jgi:hypothetical protein
MVEASIFANNDDDMFDWSGGLWLAAIPILLAVAGRHIS